MRPLEPWCGLARRAVANTVASVRSNVELTHHVEHIIARKHGGTDDPSNLCVACERCNLFNGPNLSGIDHDTGEVHTLFHPRRQSWPEHFAIHGSRIEGLTPIGRATVEVLSMNAGQRMQLRAALMAAGQYP